MLEEDKWDKEINTNLNVTARILRVALKYMFRAKKGAIVNISSLMGHRFGRCVVAYSVAKAGLNRLTETLAQEIGHKNIRINSVCPGLIDTRMTKDVKERLGKLINEFTPLRRIGQAEEVANAVLFLASDTCSSFITGHKLNIDGGLSR